MAFCIHCGTPSKGDAIFCQTCGQVLYHESLARKSKNKHHVVVIVSILAISVLVVIASLYRLEGLNQTEREISKASRQRFSLPMGAVLTVTTTNQDGSSRFQGSGFVLTRDGLAGSNYHLFEGASRAVAECCDGRVFDIQSIEGADLSKDLVVFQLYERANGRKPRDLPHVTLGSSKDMAVGDKVVTIGSPQGLENTLSDGILSAVRQFDSVSYLQITAPISPGSSGGPVFNASGQMIGVATFQVKEGQNLNFAIAAEHLHPLLNQHFQLPIEKFLSMVRREQESDNRAAASKTVDSTPRSAESVGRSLTGQFRGSVHNQTVDLSAGFAIFVRDADDVLSGCMVVKEPLYGSGPLEGFALRSEIVFVVTSEIGTITFWGRRRNATINGTYTVESEGSPNQTGTFTLHKFKSQDLLGAGFDPANCPKDADVNK